ncbi:MAG: twin-arginine translocation signal domain-containing protein [Nitrososphaeraceae archaeon]
MTDNVSRRDFLKLLGVGAMVLGLGGMGGMSQLVYDRKANRPALAQQGTGSWANGQNCTVNPIHVALLPSGRIFYLAGSGYSTAQQFGPYTARVLDINTGSETAHTQTDDLFCIGLTHLANGTDLMAGGTLQ